MTQNTEYSAVKIASSLEDMLEDMVESFGNEAYVVIVDFLIQEMHHVVDGLPASKLSELVKTILTTIDKKGEKYAANLD